MKNKGFTLIELLAMITVLGILMAITIPNITGILNNSRLNVIKSDTQNMVEKAKVKTKSNYKIKNPTENHCNLRLCNTHVGVGSSIIVGNLCGHHRDDAALHINKWYQLHDGRRQSG